MELYMQHRLLVFSVLALLVLPLQSLAQTHSGHNPAPPAEATASGHGAMMQGGAIMLEEVTDAGVKAMVHLMDTSAMMAKMGKKENYHFMIMFTDLATGKAVSQGSVALKITAPGVDKAGEAQALMAMDGQFGADISLPEKGAYIFEVGTKLADGAKRQFKFQYTVQ
jgi:hypothetical protein